MTLTLGQPGHHWVEMVDAGMAFGKATWKTRQVFPKPALSCSQLPCWESPASGSPAAEGQKLGALHLPVTTEPHTSSGPANSQGTLDPQCPDLPGISPSSSVSTSDTPHMWTSLLLTPSWFPPYLHSDHSPLLVHQTPAPAPVIYML